MELIDRKNYADIPDQEKSTISSLEQKYSCLENHHGKDIRLIYGQEFDLCAVKSHLDVCACGRGGRAEQ